MKYLYTPLMELTLTHPKLFVDLQDGADWCGRWQMHALGLIAIVIGGVAYGVGHAVWANKRISTGLDDGWCLITWFRVQLTAFLMALLIT